MENKAMFQPEPAVFVVNDSYQIMMYMVRPAIVWIQIGEECFYDDSNGILRSNHAIHRVIVPQKLLDAYGQYTVFSRKVIERKTGHSWTGEIEKSTFAFRPVSGEKVRAYHIADSHNWVEGPVKAARAFGMFDFLILNGDIPDHGAELNNYVTIFEMAYTLTRGEIPIVFARGNHEMRGRYAEYFEDFSPTDCGKSYYTFRLGNIWGIILDGGEDKPDEHPENGKVFCCHVFRERQTQFIKHVIQQAGTEYQAEGVEHKLVICHQPFTKIYGMEDEVYDEWTKLLREHIKPDVILNGHLHHTAIHLPDGEKDHRAQPCPVVIGSLLQWPKKNFAGTGLVFDKAGIQVTFTDMNGEVTDRGHL